MSQIYFKFLQTQNTFAGGHHVFQFILSYPQCDIHRSFGDYDCDVCALNA